MDIKALELTISLLAQAMSRSTGSHEGKQASGFAGQGNPKNVAA
jgi:hypothetical protein